MESFVTRAVEIAADLAAFAPEFELSRRQTWARWRVLGAGPNSYFDTFERMAYRLDHYVLPWMARRRIVPADLTPKDIQDFEAFAITTYGPDHGARTVESIRRIAWDWYLASVPLGRQYPVVPPLRGAPSLAAATRALLVQLEEPGNSPFPRGSTIAVLNALAAAQARSSDPDGAFLTPGQILQEASAETPTVPELLGKSLKLWTNPALRPGPDGGVEGYSLSERGAAVLATLAKTAAPQTAEQAHADGRRDPARRLSRSPRPRGFVERARPIPKS